MRRTKVSKRKDRKVFSQTASKGKAINLYPYTMRGGIRL